MLPPVVNFLMQSRHSTAASLWLHIIQSFEAISNNANRNQKQGAESPLVSALQSGEGMGGGDGTCREDLGAGAKRSSG